MVLIFCDFFMFNQIFHLPQVKWSVIIKNKWYIRVVFSLPQIFCPWLQACLSAPVKEFLLIKVVGQQRHPIGTTLPTMPLCEIAPPPRYNHPGTALRTKLDATSLITLMRKCIPGQLNDADVCVYQKIVKWFDFFHNHKLDTKRLIKLFASSQAFLDHSEINGVPFGLKSRDFLINGRDLLWKVQKLLWMVEIYYDRLMLRLYYERLRFS